jgi:predicted ATPase
MLTQIKLKNFKVFKEETSFPLAKINLLTGINGGGKSSLLQALLLMRQSIEQDENTSQIYLNGSCVRLGSFEDVSNVDSVEDTIGIGFSLFNLEKELSIDLDYSFIENPANHSAIDLKNLKISSSHLFYNRQSPEKTTKSIEICQNQASSEIPYSEKWVDTDLEINNNKNLNGLHRFFYLYIKIEEKQFLADTFFKKFNEIHYVSADRIGPKDFYLKENLGKFINVGAKGEMIANVIAHKKDELVNDILYLGEDAKTLEQQIQEWLKVIFGEAKFKVEDKGDIIYLYFNTKNDANWYKPSNVGFGFSYILPIIVSGLIAKEGEILIVENPEAHLHPRAQSKLTQFLAKVASGGVQVFIESHSEHILNGLRITSINQDININNEDISILYFHEKEDGYFTEIPIKPNGKIDKWPDGFFDQTENDLDIILGI